LHSQSFSSIFKQPSHQHSREKGKGKRKGKREDFFGKDKRAINAKNKLYIKGTTMKVITRLRFQTTLTFSNEVEIALHKL